jgi:hypothetical protein
VLAINNLGMTFLPEKFLMKELYGAAKFQAICEALSWDGPPPSPGGPWCARRSGPALAHRPGAADGLVRLLA